MKGDIERFIRPELGKFAGYSACKSPDVVPVARKQIVKLDANENVYGCSPRVTEALATFRDVNIYPDAEQTELRRLLQEYTGVPVEQIVCGAGSDQLIDLLVRLFVNPGEEVINLVPTFAMFSFFTELVGGVSVSVPRDADFAIDFEGIKRAINPKTKLIFLANPNNPTGTITAIEQIRRVLDLGLPTVVDEAYYEFSGHTMCGEMTRYPNLMVLRTFSKWAGLAGLRVGYGLFPPAVANALFRIKDPYGVNVAAVLAVRETMKDIDYLMGNVRRIIAERERLFSRLQQIDWLKPYPSAANFILCSLCRVKAPKVQQELERRGILVRCFDQPSLANCLRFSVGRQEDSDALIEALWQIGG